MFFELIHLHISAYIDLFVVLAVKQIHHEVLGANDNVVWVCCLADAVDVTNFAFIDLLLYLGPAESPGIAGSHMGNYALGPTKVSPVLALCLAKDLKLDKELLLLLDLVCKPKQMHLFILAANVNKSIRAE